jgi:ABC-type amino acid transport substrate-binding protein
MGHLPAPAALLAKATCFELSHAHAGLQPAKLMPRPTPPLLAAGIITSINLTSTINGRKDLAGKAVGVWDGYANLLRSTEIAAVELPWENDDDLVAMVDRLRSGTLKALLLDE